MHELSNCFLLLPPTSPSCALRGFLTMGVRYRPGGWNWTRCHNPLFCAMQCGDLVKTKGHTPLLHRHAGKIEGSPIRPSMEEKLMMAKLPRRSLRIAFYTHIGCQESAIKRLMLSSLFSNLQTVTSPHYPTYTYTASIGPAHAVCPNVFERGFWLLLHSIFLGHILPINMASPLHTFINLLLLLALFPLQYSVTYLFGSFHVPARIALDFPDPKSPPVRIKWLLIF